MESDKIIRVFPRTTKATPSDKWARGDFPGIFDYDLPIMEIHISVAFEWDKSLAENMADEWGKIALVKIGGPAYGDSGGEFEPGMYLKRGYTITSRGCPNRCWFCRAWKNEGTIRELEIKDGFNVLDNNLFACSREHQERVFRMLARQSERARFTGGFEAARFTEWHAEQMVLLKPETMIFAYDTPDDYEPLVQAAGIMREAGIIGRNHAIRCYVLIGFPGDTIEAAEARLNQTLALGYMPFAMLYNLGKDLPGVREWKRFQRTWANATIVGYRMTHKNDKKWRFSFGE